MSPETKLGKTFMGHVKNWTNKFSWYKSFCDVSIVSNCLHTKWRDPKKRNYKS